MLKPVIPKNDKSRLLIGLASIALAFNLAAGIILLFTGIFHHDLNKGLVLHLDFENESLTDSGARLFLDGSREENDGLITGGETVEGVKGDALEFNSVADKLIVADSDNFSIGEDGMTILLWVRFDDTHFVGDGSGRDYVNFARKGEDGNYEWSIREYNSSNGEGRGNRISFYVFNPEGGLGTGSYVQEDIVEGEWMHLAGVVRGNHVELWKNGEKEDSDSLREYSIIPGNGNAPVTFGSSGNTPFHGAIDDVRIYSRALSMFEIKEIYEEGKSK